MKGRQCWTCCAVVHGQDKHDQFVNKTTQDIRHRTRAKKFQKPKSGIVRAHTDSLENICLSRSWQRIRAEFQGGYVEVPDRFFRCGLQSPAWTAVQRHSEVCRSISFYEKCNARIGGHFGGRVFRSTAAACSVWDLTSRRVVDLRQFLFINQHFYKNRSVPVMKC